MRIVDVAVAPLLEPVTLDEVKLQARADADIGGIEDDLILALITSARQTVEAMIDRALITQTITLTMDGFPFGGGYYNRAIRQNPGLGNFLPTNSGQIRLPRAPVQSVSSVTYLDTAGNTRTLDTSLYRLLKSSTIPARLITATNKIWPITFPSEGSVVVTMINGYGADPSTVPAGIKVAIKMLASHWYNNRDAVAEGAFAEVPMTVKSLLAPHDTGAY